MFNLTNKQNDLICDLTTGVCGTASNSISEINLTQPIKKINILYYTDPICSSCWALEPELRKLEAEYGHYFQLQIKMGGLLKKWDGFQDQANGISKPEDVAHHWEEVGLYSSMPINGDVWLEDPLHSSYPPSIAVKAAEKQGTQFAQAFLRKIREQVFLEKKNITREEHLIEAAQAVGLEMDQFLKDYHDPATEKAFISEMYDGRRLGVRGFPTLIFVNENGSGKAVTGFQPYDVYTRLLAEISGQDIQPLPVTASLTEIINQYGMLSTKEIAVLIDANEQVLLPQLEALVASSEITQVYVKGGVYWKRK